jgi:hypothetical protein
MDYECDFGYAREMGSLGTCKLQMTEDQWIKTKEIRKNEWCEQYGYYEVTQGYRKIPGDICSSGI